MPKNVHAAHLSWIRPPIIKSVEIAKASIDTYFKNMLIYRILLKGHRLNGLPTRRRRWPMHSATSVNT